MKKIFLFLLVLSVTLFNILPVHAAQQVALNTTPVNIGSSQAASFFALYAQYDDAMATLVIDNVTSGTKLNDWVSYVLRNGVYQTKFVVTGGIAQGLCKQVNLGKVGAGSTFAFVDYAYDIYNNTPWAGWSGTVKITTS